jgi:hypothetical protein
MRDDDTPRLVVLSPSLQRTAALLAGAGVAAVAVGLAHAPDRTWSNLLLNNLYLLSIALAGALLISFHHLSGAGWSAALRRVPEAMMSALPLGALLVLSVFLGRQALYPWARPEAPGGEPLPPDTAAYLSPRFVLLRMVVILSAWVLLAWRMRRASLRQDHDNDLAHHRRLVRISAVFAVVFAFSFALASVDWLMSLQPHWYSTMFAVYVFAGMLLLGLTVLTLMVVLLRESGPFAGIVTESHLHDLGKLLFAFSTFWAYIWVCQYLLIWYGNLPEEVTHYLRRTDGPWLVPFLLNVVVNWVVPFLVLLPRATKRNPRVLKGVCALLLFGRWLDLYLLIMPETMKGPVLGPLEALIPIGYAGLFVLLAARALSAAPLVPLGDPYLEESLHHHT